MQLRRSAVISIGVVTAIVGFLFVSDRAQITQMSLGLGTGSLIVAIALGVVLTFKGSGVVNFHNGAVAVTVAYVFHGLRGAFDTGDGKLYLPPLPNPLAVVEGAVNLFRSKSDWIDLPDWPTAIDIDGGRGRLTLVFALVVALAVAAVLGLLFHLLVFRPLRSAPPLAKVVASVGLLLVLQEAINVRFGFQTRPVSEPNLGTHARRPFGDGAGIVVPENQLKIALIVVAVGVVLWAVFRFTRFGLATSAAAENEKGAMLLGFSPDRLAGANWVISTMLAGLLGILVSSLTGLDPITIPLLIIPALGAALLGGFTSFGVTIAAGLGIGMFRELIPYWATRSWWSDSFLGDWVPPAGLRLALPFVVIVAVLVIRGRSLPTRGSAVVGRLPLAPEPRHVAPLAVAGAAAVMAILFLAQFDWRQAAINTLVGVLFALSLVILTGFVGQISLAQAALAGIAGFALSKYTFIATLPMPLNILVSATLAAGFGMLVAVSALRIRGVNLAVVTFAFALAIQELVFKNPKVAGRAGALVVPPPTLLGHDIGPNNAHLEVFGLGGRASGGVATPPSAWFGVLCLVVVVLLALVVVNLRRSTTGRAFLAVRSNERAAAAAGVSVSGAKLLAFGLSAFVAGVGGVLSGWRFGSVTPEFFGALPSVLFMAFAYLGGISSVTGAVIAGLLVPNGLAFTFANKAMGVDPRYTVLVGGVGLVLTAVLNPEGIAGALRPARLRVRRVHRPGDAPSPERALDKDETLPAATATGVGA